jgi:hypothetical protein
MNLPESYFSQSIILAGDFNLLHNTWQPSLLRSYSTLAETFTEWLDRLGLVFVSEIDTPTHDRGNVLDLTFTSSSLALSGLHTRFAADLDATSDHHPLLTIFPWSPRHHEAKQRLKFDTLDHARFLALLATNLVGIEDIAKTKEELDYLADGIISAIHSAYTASATRSLPQGGGQPWWNIECKNALQDYRSELSSRKDFR